MGTVHYRTNGYKDGRGVWSIDYIAADGRRMREKIGPGKANEKLARQILAQREAEAVMGQHRMPPSRTMRFGEFADDWIMRKEPGLRSKTRESYRSMIDLHLRPAFGEMRLGVITRHDIETYLAAQREVRSRRGKKAERPVLSVTTVNYALRLLKSILADAVDLGDLSENVAARVKPLRSPDGDGKDVLHVLTPAEIGRLLEVATKPWRSLYQVAIGTGLRRGELLGLRWRDVDLEVGVLHIRRSLGRTKEGVREAPLKTKSSHRMIDLSPALVQTLLAVPAGDDPERDYVFRSTTSGPIDPDNVDRAFRRHLELGKLPTIRFHDLRHTHASLLISANVHPKAISARLGHASISITMDRYGHLMSTGFERVGARLDALLAGGTKTPEAVSAQK